MPGAIRWRKCAEALRHITAGSKVYSDSGDLSGLANQYQLEGSYRPPAEGGNSYCATCNILVLSSGLPSFDSDNVGSVTGLASVSATDAVGMAEGIAGKELHDRSRGDTPRRTSLDTHSDICQGQTISGLSKARGICPDIPSMEGSFLMAGQGRS